MCPLHSPNPSSHTSNTIGLQDAQTTISTWRHPALSGGLGGLCAPDSCCSPAPSVGLQGVFPRSPRQLRRPLSCPFPPVGPPPTSPLPRNLRISQLCSLTTESCGFCPPCLPELSSILSQVCPHFSGHSEPTLQRESGDKGSSVTSHTSHKHSGCVSLQLTAHPRPGGKQLWAAPCKAVSTK